MSVYNGGQDTSFASFIRVPPNLRRYAPAAQLYLDIPPPAPIQQHIQYPGRVRPAYRLPLQPLAHNTLPPARQHHQIPRIADQDFKMDFMFDEYSDNTTPELNTSKQSSTIPLCSQAMPTSYSFRPWYPVHNETSSNLSKDTPDLPTPAVLSTSVDVSQYESVQHRDWLEALTDYTGISPASPGIYDSSPRVEDMETFNGNLSSSRFGSWTQAHPNSIQFGRLHSIAPSITDASSASPALSYDDFSSRTGAGSWGTSMFGQPDVVLPSRLHRTPPHFQHLPSTPQEIERPGSRQSDSMLSVVPTMNSRQEIVEDEAYVKHRDKMLLDLRNKGHSYKEIKRMGRFKEAESTLRGRLRTLTKEKSERVRKPKWNAHDVRRSFVSQQPYKLTLLPGRTPERGCRVLSGRAIKKLKEAKAIPQATVEED